jgi:capsule polysaccharide export protein KpsE/RkpR
MIAARSQLEGLEQIYTRNNVRVRAMQARVNELRTQLHKIGGSSSGEGTDKSSQEFPSIRQLPLLGVKWADLYRQTKIQETVYELLTQQYELAKIQEAKEIPVVKVLDPSDVPERKSEPKRRIIAMLGTLLAFAFGVVWVFGAATWQQIDPNDPRKQLGREVAVKSIATFSRWIARSRSIAMGRGRWRMHKTPNK